MNARDHFVYRVYDAGDQLLYIGCTKNFERRWREHKSWLRDMVAAASRCKLSGPYPYAVARRLEKEAIEAENPLHNFTLARRRERAEQSRRFEARFHELMRSGMSTNDAGLQTMREFGEAS